VKRIGLLLLSLSLSLCAAETPAPAPQGTSKAEFIYPDFTQCYEKNKASIVYFGQTRAVAISEKLAIAYTKDKPTVPFLKHDYLSHLYLFESTKPLIPMKLKATSELKLGEWLVSMNDTALNVVNASKIGRDAQSLFEFGGLGEPNSIVGGLCCEMYGLGIGEKYYIGSEALTQFIEGKSASYQDLGARFVEGNESIFVDMVDSNASKTKLKVGDKITAINGVKVKTLAEFHEAFMIGKTSAKVSATLERNNLWVEENLLYVAPKPQAKKVPVVKKENYLHAKGFTFSPDLKVSSLIRGSLAEQSGLKEGDRLMQIDGMRVEKMADVDAYLAKTKNKELSLLFDRDDFQFFVTLKR